MNFNQPQPEWVGFAQEKRAEVVFENVGMSDRETRWVIRQAGRFEIRFISELKDLLRMPKIK